MTSTIKRVVAPSGPTSLPGNRCDDKAIGQISTSIIIILFLQLIDIHIEVVLEYFLNP